MPALSEVVGRIADDFTDRTTRGDCPQIEEYLARYPEYADPLRQVLPIVLAMSASKGPSVPGYEVLREIGRGGMGIVYEARNAALNRTVALKVMLFGELADSDSLQRFLGEAEMAARLRHPNIVGVYELGRSPSQPFLAMELVRGRSLAASLAGQPQPPREAANLLRRIATAVQHAHEQGVLHRDLKPANVLMDEQGEPRITDFGLAKRMDIPSGLTATGAIVGTAAYMAPEQAGGGKKIGPAADVYSLGAIFYETLTGRPPLQGVDQLETLLMVRTDDPVSPRRLVAGVPRDLETICLKCLRKEPAGRYASAGALADDLGCFLDGRPIIARPVGQFGRLLKWAWRNPVVTALLTAVVVAVSLGVAGLAWQTHRTELQRREADANFQQARQAVDECYSTVTEHPDLQGPGMQPAREVLLRTALKYYREFAARRENDPALRAEMAQTYHRVGVILSMIGSPAEAAEALEKAIELHEQKRDIALYRHQLGLMRTRLAKLDEAERDLVAALEVRAELASSGEPGDRAAHAETLAVLAGVYRNTQRPKEALEASSEAVAIREQLQALPKPPAGVRQALVESLLEHSRALAGARQPAEARKAIERAITHAEELVKTRDHVEHLRVLASARRALGIYLLTFRATPEETLAAYLAAQPTCERLASEHPRVVRFQSMLAAQLADLGLCCTLHVPTRGEEALAYFKRSLAISERLTKDYASEPVHLEQLTNTLYNLGLLHNRLRQYDQAEATQRRILEANRQMLKNMPRSNQARLDLAATLLALGQLVARKEGEKPDREAQDAFEEAQRALDEVRKTEPKHPQLLFDQPGLDAGRAQVHADRGRHAEAVKHWQRAIEFSPPKPKERRDGCRLGKLASQAALGQHAAATAEAEAILKEWPTPPGKNYATAATYFHAARVFSRASGAKDAGQAVGGYADRAMSLLQAANDAGVFDRATHIDEIAGADFGPLRGRADFTKLVESLRTVPGR